MSWKQSGNWREKHQLGRSVKVVLCWKWAGLDCIRWGPARVNGQTDVLSAEPGNWSEARAPIIQNHCLNCPSLSQCSLCTSPYCIIPQYLPHPHLLFLELSLSPTSWPNGAYPLTQPNSTCSFCWTPLLKTSSLLLCTNIKGPQHCHQNVSLGTAQNCYKPEGRTGLLLVC